MESEIKFLQGYCACLLDKENILYITKTRSFFVKFNFHTGDVQILKKTALKGSARNIMAIDEKIYVVSAKGLWLAESGIHDEQFVYYDINNQEAYGDLLYVYNYNGVIHLFFKNQLAIVTFNTKTKEIERYSMDKASELKNITFDAVCIYYGRLCMFSTEKQLKVIYSMGAKQVTSIEPIPDLPSIQCAFSEEGALYVLAANTIYILKDERFERLLKIESEEVYNRMCVANQKIWLMPIKGKEIKVYSLKTGMWEVFTDYPDDLEYTGGNDDSKFLSRCANGEMVCWMMYSNNYFLLIERESGKVSWIKPKLNNLKPIFTRYAEEKRIISEKEISLKAYINNL